METIVTGALKLRVDLWMLLGKRSIYMQLNNLSIIQKALGFILLFSNKGYCIFIFIYHPLFNRTFVWLQNKHMLRHLPSSLPQLVFYLAAQGLLPFQTPVLRVRLPTLRCWLWDAGRVQFWVPAVLVLTFLYFSCGFILKVFIPVLPLAFTFLSFSLPQLCLSLIIPHRIESYFMQFAYTETEWKFWSCPQNTQK